MTTEESLALLELHRANLANAATLEEYRYHHLNYIDVIIDDYRARMSKEKYVTMEWVAVDNKDTE